MLKEQVKKILEEALGETPTLFLVNLEIGDNNQILVVLDGDEGVSVNDCIGISREIEQNLDRGETDFSLEVSSAGVESPLIIPRQFKKNIGRKLLVKTKESTYEAALSTVTENGIGLKWKARERKPVGKGKTTVSKEIELDYSEIEEAKVMITF